MLRGIAALAFIASQQIVVLLASGVSHDGLKWLMILSPSLAGPGIVAAWLSSFGPRWPHRSALAFCYATYAVLLVALIILGRVTDVFGAI